MSEHMDTVTLVDLGAHFSYHPTYVSNLLKKETGRTFTSILRELRMTRATALLTGTTLSIEEIAAMLGFASSSNFYKAFKEEYGMTPREWMARKRF
ncbi:MAG: helix-turn-helix transcriptional regulator [Selenomonas sp.]|uniref:helix-turn-helix transcriptional regulator n=1 Tax=Selenomonas sp. TaxID=2053611 RepID=UPI0025EEDD70|nr:helix-turn-helix transcriptional regulator [Selenomonas sp.]MCI6099528.1 helix-turn-helix transcriptional regulator [Selenomonas sp.]MCI6232677.1 helix-turn-helix transcriptional regulator [Selenomonas sp.]